MSDFPPVLGRLPPALCSQSHKQGAYQVLATGKSLYFHRLAFPPTLRRVRKTARHLWQRADIRTRLTPREELPMVARTEAALDAIAERPARRYLAAAVAAALVLAAILVAAVAAGRLARDRAAAEVRDRAAAALPLANAGLVGVIETQRLIPLILARDPEVVALLAAPAPGPGARLDAKLADIAADASSSVIYVIDADGTAVAASNAGQPDSFVGTSYAFRDYFTGAMAEGAAQQYALGTVSHQPGLYIARRVDGARGPLGVVVVKVELDALEERWRESGFLVLATDAEGVVLGTSVPNWRFGTTAPLTDPAAVRAGLQLDADHPMPALPIADAGDGLFLVDTGGGRRRHAGASALVGPAAPDLALSVYAPAEATLRRAGLGAQLTVLLAGLLAAAILGWLLRRRRWALARQAALALMNAELETRVAQRTDELNRSNQALAAEMAEREVAETRARRLRDELAQANRLSILGQIAAGVAHEINQPVAAIRTYAETGRALIAGGRTQDADENLQEIARVTDRIGSITQMLRGFARRSSGAVGPIEVDAALDGALALLAGRIRDAGATVERQPHPSDAKVVAGRIRLEQILVNLLQNALDATRGQADPRIDITVATHPETVTITVADNGPGLDAAVREHLFMPFHTTKESGLGLGLVISSDIAREFGGSLRLDSGNGPGAAFTLELRRA
jgi:two-component system C4-dicarboxylate transport sensor histidine kinase DctB